MTQEEKSILLQDLCARLPYGVKVDVNFYDATKELSCDLLKDFIIDEKSVRPYLRPMSSMTEEEFESLKQYSGLIYGQLDLAEFQDGTYKCLDFYLSEIPSYVVILVFDWLSKHHFDYRGLIEKGLALEAPEGIYNVK